MSGTSLPIVIRDGRILALPASAGRDRPGPADPLYRAALRALIDGMATGALVADAAGTIVCANAAAQALFADPALEGRSVDDLVPPALRDAHRVYRSVFATLPVSRPMARYSHLLAQRADGEAFCVQIELTPFATAEGLWTAASIRAAAD